MPVPGGTEDERLTPLTVGAARPLQPRTDAQIEADLDRLEQGQQDDGGWTFDWLACDPGAAGSGA